MRNDFYRQAKAVIIIDQIFYGNKIKEKLNDGQLQSSLRIQTSTMI